MKRISLALLLLLCGCVSAKASYKPITVAGEAETLRKKAVRALVSEGMTVATNDAEAGLVATEWEVSDGIGPAWRHRIVVEIDDASATVKVDCEAEGVSGWGKCSEGKREQRFVDRANAVAGAMR